MSEKKRILIVDDDTEIRDLLEFDIASSGYFVDTAADGMEGLNKALNGKYDLILLDVMMPKMNGFDVCKNIRQAKINVPILMLTAKGTIGDKTSGFDSGADDYLPKPFNPKELLARIKAVLRRHNRELPGAPSQQVEVVQFGPWTLDLSTRTLTRDGNVVTLTTGEFSVLKALVQHPREPLTRDKLMNLARGREWGAMERSIDVQISRLRRLIENDPSQARYIQTVWGVGYVFVPDGAA